MANIIRRQCRVLKKIFHGAGGDAVQPLTNPYICVIEIKISVIKGLCRAQTLDFPIILNIIVYEVPAMRS
jgi:hypothetical protein